MSTESKNPNNYILNVAKVRDNYAKLNPNFKALSNIDLSNMTGKHKQFFSDWQKPGKEKPMLLVFIAKMVDNSLMDLVKLKKIAARWEDNSRPDIIDILLKLCEIGKYDLKDILEYVE